MTSVLIIEDNADNLELMRYLLSAYGYEVVGAMRGEQALKLIDEWSFDLILCDIQMPEMDGFEVLKRLRQCPQIQNAPVIAVSAFAMVGDRGRILAAGFDGYIPKPIDPEFFVERLESYLPEHMRSKDSRPSPLNEAEAIEGPERQKLTHSVTILVIDDEASNVAVLCSILEPSGYTVLTARNGDEALEHLSRGRPDLILADLHLGTAPNYDLIQRVKAQPEYSDIPFVFISSTSSSQKTARLAREQGAVGFLFRPISPQSLLNAIEKYLKERPEGTDHGDHTHRR